MWPTLITIGPISIYTFGILIFLGIFFGGFRLWKNAKEEGWDESDIMDIWLAAGLGSLIGSRIVYILVNWPEFSNNWYKMLFLTKFPGLNYEGAWLFGLMSLLYFGARKKTPFWHLFDVGVLAILIVEIFGHIGSFFAGNNLGQPTNSWWGLAFPGQAEKRWPVQIIWVLGLFLIYQILKFAEQHYRSFKWYQNEKGEAKNGFISAIYLILIGILKLFTSVISSSKPFIWSICFIVIGGLILIFRSGITFKAKSSNIKKVKVEFKRKKKGFDYV